MLGGAECFLTKVVRRGRTGGTNASRKYYLGGQWGVLPGKWGTTGREKVKTKLPLSRRGEHVGSFG